jgi:uncharacterized protein YbcI
MEPVTIVNTIATIIFGEIVKKQGEKIGESVSQKCSQLVTAVRAKLATANMEGILTEAEKEPTEANQSVFKTVLKSQVDKDEQFANQLREFIEQLKSAGAFSDNAQGLGSVTMTSSIGNIHSTGNVTIGDINKYNK